MYIKSVLSADGTGAPRRPSREITIQDLLLHTSGLSHRTSDLYRKLQVRSRAIALPQFVVNITKAPLLEDPGTRFRYSEATTVLGRIVEVVSKQPFDTFVTARILKPLGMRDTAFWVEPAARERLATVYQRGQDGSIAPFEIETAREMIAELRGAKLFDGYRGKPAGDREALARALVAASEMAAALAPRLKEADINPLFVGPGGVMAADALVVLR